MFDSTHSGMTRSSIHDNDFLELVWENGQVIASNREHKTPDSFKGYSTSPPHKETGINHEDVRITKRTRLSTLYSLYDHFPSQKDSDTDMSSSHQRNGQDSSHSSQIKNSFKDKEQFINLLRSDKDSKQVTTCNNNNHLCTDSSQLSSPPKKQRTDSNNQPTPATDSHHFGCHQRERKVNFSNFSVPTVFLKPTSYHGKSATKPPRNAILDEIEARKVEKAEAAEAAKGSDIGLKRLQNQTPCVQRNTELAPLDEHSEAVGNGIHRSYGNQASSSQALRAKGKANNRNQCNEQFLASSSVCSLGTSNDPNFGTRRHEGTDESTYLSDNDGEAEDVVKETSDREECSRVKRSRNPKVHNLTEKKRREKINKKMRALKELIPNCNKVDKASMLDDAIDYLKALKLQLQIMTMGNGLLMNMMHHMNGAQLIGLRPTQFPIPPPPLSAITDNRLHHQMFGLNNQMPQMPQMPIPHHPPFFPVIPNCNSTKPHLMATTTNHIPNSAPLQVSLPLNSSLIHAKAENVAMQVPNQVSLPQHSVTPPPVPFIFPQ